MDPLAVSVVMPAYNEAVNLPVVLSELRDVLDGLRLPWEIVVVDDGSTDATRTVLDRLETEVPGLRQVRLGSNLGKSAALDAGLGRAGGEVIVLMDADGQDDPAELPKLLSAIDDGLDMVTGSRSANRADRLVKRSTSRVYNRVTRAVTGIDAADMNSGFKVMRSETANALTIHGELHRYLPVLAAWSGFSVGEVPVTHRQRLAGETKFGVNRFWRGLLDLLTVRFLTRYTGRPFHLFGGIGLISGLVGSGLLVWMLIDRLSGATIGTRPALIAGVLFTIMSVQLLSFGLLGELIAHGNARRGRPAPGREVPPGGDRRLVARLDDDLETGNVGRAEGGTAFQDVAIGHMPIEHVPIEHVPIEHVPIEGIAIDDVRIAPASRRRGPRPDDQVVLIRSLSPVARLTAVFLVACVTAPVVLAFLRIQGLVGAAPRFTAFGDSAYLALRSRDVFAGPTPLVGSQSSVATAVMIMQPGPAQFFAQAPWVGWLGGDLGSLLFAAVASASAAVGVVWVILRRFGVLGAAAAALIVIVVEAQLGAGALVAVISSSHGQLPALFAVLICAMVVTGDLRLFPLAVAVSSYVLQVHLSLVGYGLLVIPLLVAALAVGIWRTRRDGASWFAPWAVAGVVIGVAMWAPPLIDQFSDTGNMAKVFSAASGGTAAAGVERPTDELTSGLASVFGPIPALLAPPDRPLGVWYFDRSDAQTNVGLAVGAGAVIAGLSSFVIGLRRGRRATKLPDGEDRADAMVAARRLTSGATVLLCGVVLALIGVLFASRLRGLAVLKPNNNRWIVIAGAVVWLGALLTLGSSRMMANRVRRQAEGQTGQARNRRRVGALVAVIVLAGSAALVGTRPLEPTVADPWLGGSRALAPAVRGAWGDRGPVRFRSVGPISAGGLQPALMLDMEEHGAGTLTVGGVKALRAGYGDHRLAANGDPPYVLLQDGATVTPKVGEPIGFVVARPTAGDGSARADRIRACLERADDAGAAVMLTAEGRRAVVDPELVGDEPENRLLAAALADPKVLFLTGLSSEAVGRGYIEPIQVDGCDGDDLDELAGELLLSAWLVS
ncbi:MAG: glycosyltransferase family 2 protein [Candidatus Microthrix sp.]|uniref:Glycosyltransferase family 2 protein n=1 Tax=Candidatus Neomicrothrix subdominans TaxID=2954438 RepID=A0A936N9V2_9ACTN|nr:glycosyltransferase family 2 protein [Candidatus Microthrix subdominans]